MMNPIQSMAHACKSFYRKEDGTSTLEFMMVLPAAMFFFAASYESGMIGLRNVMLERAVDVTVRQVRIGAVEDPSHNTLKEMICEAASIIPNCMTSVKLEMVRKNIRAWTPMSAQSDCVDRSATGEPVINWTSGGNNELMILRACALFAPMLPTSAVGAASQTIGDEYALVATSSFVVEPYK
ncbi:MAG: Flp pilus assembly protein TadG [Yoonia sp.]|jgi:Flp pilus assembly protein TadG